MSAPAHPAEPARNSFSARIVPRLVPITVTGLLIVVIYLNRRIEIGARIDDKHRNPPQHMRGGCAPTDCR